MPNHMIPSLALIALLSGAAASAAEIVVTPAAERSGDGGVLATLIFLNDEGTALTPPATIEALLTQDDLSAPVSLNLVSDAMALRPGGYAKLRYQFAVPDGMEAGKPLKLDIGGDMAVTASLIVAAPVATASAAEDSEKERPAAVQLAVVPPDSRAEPEALDKASPDGNLNFSTYRPAYALLGTSPLNAKIQFSFKYALVDPDGDAASDFSFLRGIYLGFTQTMFWDLGVDSSPFRSIDFQPELFYRYRSDLDIAAIQGSDFNIQAGIKHYSNGKGDPDPELTGNPDPMGPDETDSRSFNTVYVEPSISLALGPDYRLTAAPRAWVYFGDLEDNPDIGSFRGNSSLRLTLARRDGAQLETYALGFIGTGRGSLQTDLSYPVKFGFLDDVNLRLHGQLFTGYGDNLLDYNRKSTRFRLGVSLIP